MSDNKEVISRFYTAFSQLDAAAMNACYSENIVFSDPVFMMLEGDEVKAMWEMLCRNAKNFSCSFSDIELIDEEYATCRWQATYLFSRTGNKVVNNGKAYMRLKDGLITEHSDGFRLSSWISQAFGWKGVLLGWTGFMKRKVQLAARKNLLAFMEQQETV